MWQMYHATKDEMFYENAKIIEKELDRVLMMPRALDHDNGFRWLPTAVANYRVTKDANSLDRGLLAAGHQAGRFNPVGNFIRAWNDDGDGRVAGWAIIDCLMNLPLFYWASEKLNDPHFAQIAKKHADTAMKYFVREDGSVKHIVSFDPNTGEVIRSYGGQGAFRGSSWTRGQAWALYGFTLIYLHSQEMNYLETAKRVANYFISKIPDSGLSPIDFCQPEDVT